MDSIEQTTDVLVIGAGMAGLIAAAELQRAGRSVRVLDKGRGVGGRLASRRIEGATFDHGAPGFTASHPWFATEVVQARLNGTVTAWTPGSDTSHPDSRSWRGTPSMSAVPKQLARGLDLQLETTVTDLRPHADRWLATTASGQTFASRAVVLTAPVPQALVLLRAGGLELAPALRSRLDALEYERCLTVMAVLDADRFGIAQLHQLRGRVGRGSIASQCWLQTKDPEISSPRVDALVESTDGFYLAEVDLELRGEGTLMNSMQKGASDLKLASLRRDRDLIDMAREAAFLIVDADPTMVNNAGLLDELDLLLTPEDAEFLFKN